ncbi:MAG: tetratricopeptide repeat protein [Myxococcales bacterium]
MAELTVANYLAALQDDPWDQSAVQGLDEALSSGDPKRLGEDPVRLLEFARRNHEVRGEAFAAAKLIEFELRLVLSDPDFAAVLWRELGRLRREDLMDDEGAKFAYEKALELRPGEEEVQRALEQIAQVSERWQQIAQHFAEQAEGASDAALKTSLMVRSASILWQYKKKGKSKDTDRLFREALSIDPAHARAARLFAITLREREKWKELGEVLLSSAEHVTGRDDQLGMHLSAARVLAQRLSDNDRAAACYERVLELLPAHEESLGFLVAHFTERELWDHLVALYEDALRARQLKADAEQGILLQIGMVHWRMLKRADRAEPYFARLRKADAAQPVMLDFYREQYTASGETSKLLAVLSDAQRRLGSEQDKLRLSLEIARLAQNDSQAAERAIDAFKHVLRSEPTHAEALASLKQLYRRSGKWNALVELLRGELDALPADDRAGRLIHLKELLAIYRDELKLDAMVLGTYNLILQLDPKNREATDELAKTYESLGRWNDLIPVLTREADVLTDPARKVALYLRVAKLWIEHFSNYNQATGPLEQVIAIDSNNREALALLKEIYGKKRAWKQLFGVLLKEEELASDKATKLALLVELANIAGERLHEYGEAINLWRRVLELEPNSAKALDALEKLAERAKDWDALADALERRLSDTSDVQAKIKLLTRLGTLHAERTNDPVRAAAAWKRVLEVDAKNGRALRTLREAYLAAGDFASVESLYAEAHDWDGFVDVLGTAADKTSDVELKKTLSFRAAEVYERELGEPARAFRSYERVLGVDPENTRAVRALLPLYEKDEKWPRVAQLNEILLKQVAEGDIDTARALHLRLVELFQGKLRDGERAFSHASSAYALAPDDAEVRARLESAADLASAHERLARIYVTRADAEGGEESVALRRRVAQLCLDKLKRPEEAAHELEKVLEAKPSDADVSATLERIYRGLARHKDLRALFVKLLKHAASDDARFERRHALAVVDEELLRDLSGAIESYQAMHELRPSDAPTLATLDRLLSAENRSQELAGILDKRIELASQAKEQVELTLRLGKLAAGELADSNRAIEAFSRVLELEPTEGRAVEALELLAAANPSEALRIGRLLEPVYERTSKLDKLQALLKKRLEASKSDGEKRDLKLRLAEISGTLGDPKSAYATLESAFLDNPQNVELWDRITSMADQARTHEELAVAFATVIEMAALPAEQTSALSERTARIYDSVLGQPERAEPFHLRVLAHDPLAEGAYEALRDLYTNTERWEELKKLYRDRIANTVDVPQKLDLLLQVCFLHEEILDDVEMAITSYQEVLELDPTHSTSRRALERLYTRAERYRELVSLLEYDRNEAMGKEAIELTFRIGELYELKLKEPALAVDQHAQVLEEQPTHLRAQEALERLLHERTQRQRIAGLLEPLYTRQGAHNELARILEVQLEEISEPGARVSTLMRLGELHERELRDATQALRSFAKAVETDPTDVLARRELARLSALVGALADRASLLENSLKRVEIPSVRTEILAELAELWDVLVGNAEKAIDAYTRLIASDAENAEIVLPAARALERLHLVRDDHANLAEALRLQITFENDVEIKKALLGRLAELSEGALSDVPRAVAAYVERLDLDPADLVAMLALERLYESRAEWPNLIGILQKREAVALNEHEGRVLARRVGEVYETKLHDREKAIDAYTEVLSRFGNDRETVVALERVYEASEKYQELLDTLQIELELATDPQDRAEVRFRSAELMRKRTNAPESALDAYRAVLEERPGHDGTIGALNEMVASGGTTRVDAARVLVPHYDARGDHERLIHALEVVAESDDARERLESLRRAAASAERGLSDAGRAYSLIARAVQGALGDDELGALLEELDRLARASGRFEAYGNLLREIAPDVSDEELRVLVLMRAAGVSRDQLSDRSVAREYFEQALALRPDHRPALDALEALHQAADDHRGLLNILRKKTELAGDTKERTALLLRQAELSAYKLDDVTAAIEAYEQVLEESPSREVFDGLAALYQRAERWEDLSEMYERQMELAIGDALVVRYRLAEVYRTRLDDVERALDLYRDVLDRSPLHEETTKSLEALMDDQRYKAQAAAQLEPVYLRKSKWPELTRALEAQLEAEESPERKKELLLRLAQLHEVQLEDLETALETYARLFRVEPADVQAWDALARLSRVLGRQERVAEVYELYLDEVGIEDETGIRLAVSAAQIRDQFGRNLERSSALYQKALAVDPTALSVADALEDVLLRRRASEDLRAFYRAQADVAGDDKRRVACLHKLAKVLELELRESDVAIRVHQELLEVVAGDSVSVAALDRLLAETQAWSALAEHLQYQIDRASDSANAAQLKLRLAKLYEEHLDDVNLAIDTHEDVTRLEPNNREARGALERFAARPELLRRVSEILEPLYAQAGEWSRQIWLYEKLVGIESDLAERSRLYGEIARLHEAHGKSPREAMAAWRRTLVTDPADDHARSELERLAAELADWDALVQAFEEAIEATADNQVKASLLAAVARTHDERRGDPRSSITAYERLIQYDSEDPAAFDQLEALLTMVGDWRGLVNLFKRKVERSYDSVERSELWRRAGSVLDELIGDVPQAIEAYRAALEETDDDVISLEALDGLFTRTEDFQALSDVLRRRSELGTSTEERLDVNLRLGRVLAEKLERTTEAIEAYVRVLDEEPTHMEAIRSLAKLYEEESSWPELLDTLRRQLDVETATAERLALFFRIGQVHDERQNEFDEAIEAYREALSLDPAHEPSIKALLRIGEQSDQRPRVEEILEPTLRDHQRWDDLATLLARGVSSMSEPSEKQARLLRLAEIHERGRNDQQAAFDTLCEALLSDADDENLAGEVERVAGALDAWGRTADVFARRAGSTSDVLIAQGLYRRVARIAEQQLNDVARAIEANERALERAGDDETVLADLDRLYLATERFEDLADILERRVVQADNAGAVELLVRLGELRESRFEDPRGALSAYREVIDREPSDARATGALERLLLNPDLASEVVDVLDSVYRQSGKLDRVAELYETRIRQAGSQSERVSLLTDLASLFERELGDLGRAAQALRRAFEADPSDHGLLDEIERVATAAGSFDVLSGLVETATRGGDVSRMDKRDLWMRGYTWYRERLGDTDRAEQSLRRALDMDPEYEPAHEQLVSLLREGSRHRDLVEALSVWAERDSDRGQAVLRLCEAAAIAESGAGDRERAIACYERVLSMDSSALNALDELIRLQEAEGRLGKVAQLYDRRIDAESDPSVRQTLRHRAAVLRADQLEDREGAIRLHLANLDDEPNDAVSMDALERFYRSGEQWQDLVRILERRLEVATTPEERSTARVGLALVAEQQLKNPNRAIDELREVLSESPDHAQAQQELLRLLESGGRYPELVEALEARADRFRDLGDDAGELSTLVRLGAVIEDKLGDRTRAAEFYERVLERDAQHVGALRALARLYMASDSRARSGDLRAPALACRRRRAGRAGLPAGRAGRRQAERAGACRSGPQARPLGGHPRAGDARAPRQALRATRRPRVSRAAHGRGRRAHAGHRAEGDPLAPCLRAVPRQAQRPGHGRHVPRAREPARAGRPRRARAAVRALHCGWTAVRCDPRAREDHRFVRWSSREGARHVPPHAGARLPGPGQPRARRAGARLGLPCGPHQRGRTRRPRPARLQARRPRPCTEDLPWLVAAEARQGRSDHQGGRLLLPRRYLAPAGRRAQGDLHARARGRRAGQPQPSAYAAHQLESRSVNA